MYMYTYIHGYIWLTQLPVLDMPGLTMPEGIRFHGGFLAAYVYIDR